MRRRGLVIVAGAILCGALLGPAGAQQTAPVSPEFERLKAQLAAQQEQIDQLRHALEEQKKTLEEASRPKPASIGEVASTTPIIPATSVAPALHPSLPAIPPSQASSEPPPSPLQIHIGTATIMPVGFMDFTGVFRSASAGSGIGTNFGSIPYNTSPTARLSEFRLSAQNSRIGARIDAMVHGAKVLGYWESDFLGFSPVNAGVSTNSNSFRMRLYWVDVRKDKWEILGGQSWSMLTPGRKGISPLPSDLFYSQDVDVNYQVGLTWSRQPGFRLLYHPSNIVHLGLALESAEQYGGGSGGGGVITMPASLYTNPPSGTNAPSGPYGNQINTGNQTFNTPNLHPDVIGKIAFDPMVNGKLMHVEFAGLLSSFKFFNPLNGQHYTTQGGGGSANFNLELAKNFRFIANTYFSDGGGRYLFGTAPDLIIRADGSPSPIHASSTVDGFEYQAKNTLFYAYYGGVYIGRNTAIDPANKNALIGYGYSGSSNSQNRTIQEGTFGLTQTFWKSPNYGSLQFMLQYSYLFRNPWYHASTAPRDAHNSTVFINLRYALPGGPPSAK
ncbi:MAG: hypothetical protein U0Q18_04980 [Bryobacteraceae bacterium]